MSIQTVSNISVIQENAAKRAKLLPTLIAHANSLTEVVPEERRGQVLSDNRKFFPAMKKLSAGLAKSGADEEHVTIGLYSIGFELARMTQGAVQCVPDHMLRSVAVNVAKEFLAPEAEPRLKKLADRMQRSSFLFMHDAPTKEEWNSYWGEQKENIKSVARALGDPKEVDNIEQNLLIPPYEEEKAKQWVERAHSEFGSVLQEAPEQAKALDAAGVSANKKAGSLLLTGYLAGTESILPHLIMVRLFAQLAEKLVAVTGEDGKNTIMTRDEVKPKEG